MYRRSFRLLIVSLYREKVGGVEGVNFGVVNLPRERFSTAKERGAGR
jgi:hypothetical protein